MSLARAHVSPLTTHATILVVDDAAEHRLLVRRALEASGHDVVEAADGDAALAVARDAQPDVIVLDLVLPDVDGVEVCRQIRMFSDAYIVMLTSRADEVDKLIGLAVGADDYMTKPYSPRELSARVGALMRRPRTSSASASLAPAGPGAKRSFGDLELDPLAREVWVAGREVALTRIEFDLLDSLSRRPDMVHTRQMLLELVWGPNWIGDDHVVDVHIANLRKKIDQGDGSPTGDSNRPASHIRTVRGVGYRMG